MASLGETIPILEVPSLGRLTRLDPLSGLVRSRLRNLPGLTALHLGSPALVLAIQ